MRYCVKLEAEIIVQAESESQAADLAVKAARAGGIEVQALSAIPMPPPNPEGFSARVIAEIRRREREKCAEESGICLAD